jgi:predicted AAA+ superfamily ATPase
MLLDQDARDVILVEGARQVGKTTLIKNCLAKFSDVYAINLETDTSILREIDRTESFEEFTRVLTAYFSLSPLDARERILFIDEAQESEKIGSYVRSMKEIWKHLRVILSGSSMNRIFRKDQRIPVGRYRSMLVTPFTFEEFLRASAKPHLIQYYEEFTNAPKLGLIDGAIHKQFLELLDLYFEVGGLPAVVASFFSNGNFRAIRNSILDSQEDDFVRKSSLSERSYFKAGLRGTANYIGMPSKTTQIHEKFSVAEKIISELLAWKLIVEVEQRGQEPTSKILPKRYLYDIGIAQDLREMPFPKLSIVTTTNPALRTQLGGLFENALLLQILSEQGYQGHMSGWKKSSHQSTEVDFVWRLLNTVVPLECKATLSAKRNHYSGLAQYLDVTGLNFGILVSAAPFSITKRGKNTFLNLPLYLASGANITRLAERAIDL